MRWARGPSTPKAEALRVDAQLGRVVAQVREDGGGVRRRFRIGVGHRGEAGRGQEPRPRAERRGVLEGAPRDGSEAGVGETGHEDDGGKWTRRIGRPVEVEETAGTAPRPFACHVHRLGAGRPQHDGAGKGGPCRSIGHRRRLPWMRGCAGRMKALVQKRACAARPHTREQNRGTRRPWLETRARIPQDADGGTARAPRPGLASGDVESHFHVEGDLSDLGLGPGHVLAPSVGKGQPESRTIHGRMGPCKKKMHRPESPRAHPPPRAWPPPTAVGRASPASPAGLPGGRAAVQPKGRPRPETAPAGSC